jgi:hypothetical protein
MSPNAQAHVDREAHGALIDALAEAMAMWHSSFAAGKNYNEV